MKTKIPALFYWLIISSLLVLGIGAYLKYVILDKNVTIRPGTELIGTKNSPIIIKRGETL